ncbi:MAG TPA: hypothetical protein VF491_19050 [Vicinamibacterales bacterium]
MIDDTISMKDQSRSSWALRVRRSADIAIVIACLAAGAFVGSRYYHDSYAAGGKPWFYQVDFGPAVMWTCGHGFVLPDVASMEQLGRFLRQEVDQFSCDELPPQPTVRPLVGSHPWLTWSNLMRSAAAIWMFTGIAWSRLAPLAGILFGLTVAITFLLLRLVSGRLLAITGACFVLTSPLFIVEIPQFRDFAKVPFMLGLAWLMAQLLAPSNSSRRLMTISMAYGALLGVAIGFRNDALITIPPFVLVLMAARQPAGSNPWRQRSSAMLLAAIAFAAFASPVLRAYTNGGGSASSHAAFLGLMQPVETSLGVSNGRLYEVGYGLDDSYAAAVISGYASRKAGAPRRVGGHSPEYDAAATAYYLDLLRTMPADALARVLASIDRVVAMPSGAAEAQSISYIAALRPFYALRSRLLLALWWIWLPAVLAALLLVSLRDFRLAVILGVLFVYFAGYPAIQFSDRHILHLSVIPLASAAFVLQTLFKRQWGREWRNAVTIAAIGIAVVAVPLFLLRTVQESELRALIHGYLSAPTEPVNLTDRVLTDAKLALDFPVQRESQADGVVTTDYLIAEFGASGCSYAAVDLTVRYEASHAFADFTRRITVSVPRERGSARVAIATYSYSIAASPSGEELWYHAKGYEIPAAQRPCLTKVTRLRDPNQFPVLLNTTLPDDWENLPLYLTLARWERRRTSVTPAVYLSPPDAQLARVNGSDGSGDDPLGSSDLVAADRIVTMPIDGRLSVSGVGGLGGVGPFAYLAQFRERHLRSGQRLIVEGELKAGGLSAGWLSNGAWNGQIAIREPGRFVAVFEVPEDGVYSFVIANNLTGSSLRNVCDFTRLAWLP